MKLDYLAFAAHPDDVELAMGGTIAKLTQSGKQVGIVDLTRGEMGSRGTIETRARESADSAKILQLSVRENLGLTDSELQSNRKSQIPLIEVLRKYKPTIVFINAPEDRHPDHGNGCTLEIESIFYAGLRKIETYGLDGEKQQPWRPSHIIHYMQDRPFEPSFVMDVTETFDKRLSSIQAFSTQFNVKESTNEPQTYISSPRFFEQIEGRARFYGHMIGAEYGEPFLYHKGAIPITDFEFLEKNFVTR
jgi:bacillithiol biosynthesis deacetylase BshB1